MTAEESKRILEDGCFSMDAATEWSGLSRVKLRGAMDTGKLPYIRDGKRLLIPRRGLRDYLTGRLMCGNAPVTPEPDDPTKLDLRTHEREDGWTEAVICIDDEPQVVAARYKRSTPGNWRVKMLLGNEAFERSATSKDEVQRLIRGHAERQYDKARHDG